MRRLLFLSLAGLWLFSPRRRCATAGAYQPTISGRRPKLVIIRPDAGFHHLADVSAGDFTDDDELHAYHHCFWPVA